MRRRRSVWCFVLAVFAAVLVVTVRAQEPTKNSQPEQTSFSADWVPVKYSLASQLRFHWVLCRS